MIIKDCKTNHLTDPLGYEINCPVFSYIVEDAKGSFQKEARIIVATDKKMEKIVFDSGFTDKINSLAYKAEFELKPRTRYFWTVTVHTDANEEATSRINWFETGKMNEKWLGEWITCDWKKGEHPLFEKKFIAGNQIKTARLYICGLGLYEASINGVKTGNEYLTPYCNDYDSWLQYQTYDITEQILPEKENKITVILGNGWYKGRFGCNPSKKEGHYGNSWELIAEIHIVYEDGVEELILTDSSWQVRKSAITFSNIYDGEWRDDSMKKMPLKNAQVTDRNCSALHARQSLPVRVYHEMAVKEIIHTPAGETVIDMGQNFAGIFRMRVQEPKGKKVHLQFGEILQEGNFYRENLRSAAQEYIYISDGSETILEPKFTFYGYRYVKVTGIENLKKKDFTGLAFCSELPETGSIKTGNQLVNCLIQNTRWGMRSNFIDIPTDCPQRDERLGWTGDAQVFSPTASYFCDTYAFYRKYLTDMSKEQKKRNGCVPNVIPAFGENETSSVWGDAACIIPWNLYLFYGDKSILEERYEDMKAWVNFISKIDEGNGKWKEHFHWGDWLALDNPSEGAAQVFGGTDPGFIADIYYMNSAHIVSESARLLEKEDDEKVYKDLENMIRKRILDEYYSPNGRCCISTQTAYLLTLKYHLSVSEKKAEKILRKLFSQKNDRLQTGFVGTPIMCNVLSEHGMTDLAYKLLLNEDYPGWLYAVKLGATTIWERWNSLEPDGRISSTGMNSMNHYSYGSIVEWLWKYTTGIIQEEDSVGFRKVYFRPMIEERLGSAEGIYHSTSGTWECAWKILNKDHLYIRLKVPFGCSAKIRLPYAGSEVYEENTDHALFQNVHNGICHLTAGTYEITYRTCCTLIGKINTKLEIGQLLKNETAVQIISEAFPGFITHLPEDVYQIEFREFALQYGGMAGVTEERLEQLDKKLERL